MSMWMARVWETCANPCSGERGKLGDDGVVVVSLVFDTSNGGLVGVPRLTSYGFMDEAPPVLDEVGLAIEAEYERRPRRFRKDAAAAVRHVSRRVIRAETGRRPVVLTVVSRF